MKKKPPDSQTNSSLTMQNKSTSYPVIKEGLSGGLSGGLSSLLVLLFYKLDYSSWPLSVWIIFIPIYLLILISGMLYLYHWNHKKNIEEDIAKKISEFELMSKEKEIEQANTAQQALIDILNKALDNPTYFSMTCEHNSLLGDNVRIEINHFGPNKSPVPCTTICNRKASSSIQSTNQTS